ncbi:transcriptional regulator [Streptomyces sp. V4-01]|uniref:Transcriptional regulator n=1 Tax=Actinacidiphila polyblastidii TaxID=3110430 RepID=A0ABU7PD98_9ACTN|nr:transcriptional regulator [Streptomyces sp. V4-01]
MPATPNGSLACTDADRPRRLAAQLADMIPGAATVRVSLTDPTRTWPDPHAVAKDASGKPVELSRKTAKVAARWILRVWPEADWTGSHTFDLATVTLTRSDLVAAGRGR